MNSPELRAALDTSVLMRLLIGQPNELSAVCEEVGAGAQDDQRDPELREVFLEGKIPIDGDPHRDPTLFRKKIDVGSFLV